jgi:integrase/recombinase XerD
MDALDQLAQQQGTSALPSAGTDGGNTFTQAAYLAAARQAQARFALVQRYTACLAQRRYSARTAKNYTNAFKSFLNAIEPRLPIDFEKAEVEEWLASHVQKMACSISHQNTLINAIQLYYSLVENRPCADCLFTRPKREEVLPTVLTKAEVQRILALTQNVKHRCLILMAYSTGLKLKELLHLRSHDLNLKRMMIQIRTSHVTPRGRCQILSREVPLSPKLATVLQDYFEACNPRVWLFEGEQPGQPYSERSVQAVVRQAAARAGIDRPISMNILRNSYAVHQLEAGVAVRAVQDILGHENIRSTARYAHVARRKLPASPADLLEL